MGDCGSVVVGAVRRRRDVMVVVAGVFLMTFITALDSSATMAIQPQVLSDFGAMARGGAVSVVTLLLQGGARLGFTQAAVYFGYPAAGAGALALHTAGFLACAAAHSFAALFAGTIVWGLGMTGFATLAAIAVADTLPLHLRGSVAAYASLPSILNYFLGVELGGRLVRRWRWVYGALCIVAVACAAPIALALRRVVRRAPWKSGDADRAGPRRPWPRRLGRVLLEVDAPGLALITGGLLALLAPIGLQANAAHGWASAAMIAPLVTGAVTLAAAWYYEARVARWPAVPGRLLRVRTMACAVAAATLFYYALGVTLLYYNTYLQTAGGLSAHTAMLLEQGTSGVSVGLLAAGWAMQWSRRYRRWAGAGWALALLAAGLMTHSRGAAQSSKAEVVVVQLLFGTGAGLVVGSLGVGVQAAVAGADVPIAISLFAMSEYVGCVLGQGTATAIWMNVLPARLASRLPSDVDVQRAINNLTYYQALPSAQQTVVNDAYTHTQLLLTVCGICAITLAGAAMLGLEPLGLEPPPAPTRASTPGDCDRDSLTSGTKDARHVAPAEQ
ncbi:hypothetical protein IWQ56_001273 [Coemansia nantahalensis]|uniref:Uncharacterized protein n=1 Tax=Coemansia helicoidea TaxID=1286919 RepID=A0ACC1L661_9FUNG|nr:hypothetical protein IWQ56_001273 [Coemansia nantahalensis]KAJ2801586.1 hypothetical protein H4R21_002745 [Coemansia helicoidea]